MAAWLCRCLDKDPSRRWRDIGDVKFEIGNDESTEISTEAPPRTHWGVLVAGALVVAGVAAVLAWNLKPESPSPVSRFTVDLPDANFSYAGRRVIAFSPDGSLIAYVANRQLHLRALDQMESVPLADTRGARTPFFSPDGEWLGFFANNALNKVSVRGGPRVRLCIATNVFGASWADDGTILFGQGAEGIWRVSAQGSEPEVLVELKEGERAYGPELLPGGKVLLYSVTGSASWDEGRIEVRSLDSGETKVLIRRGSDARYVPTGHLVYALGDTILAVPFDADALELRAGPVPILTGVARSQSDTAAAHASFSRTGSLAFVAQDQIAARTLVWADRSGRVGEPLVEPANYLTVMPSPDGSRLALVKGMTAPDIWILDDSRNTLTRFTTEGALDPVWSPDGEWLAFQAVGGLYRKRSDFSGIAAPVLEKDGDLHPYAYSPDGKWLVYGERREGVQWDLWGLPLQGESEPVPLAQSQFDEWYPTMSPDGRYLAYVSSESGRSEIYVTPFPDTGRKWQLSTGGGRTPLWSSDGREILYVEYGEFLSKIMTAHVETSPEFESSLPELVLEMPTMDRGDRHFGLAADGERIVMLRDVNTVSGRIQFNVVLNWFEELERIVPTR